MTRCRNCGNPAHKTQNCPRFGPWYPEPGKSKADYTELEEEINRKVAADILAEHEGHDGEDNIVMAQIRPAVGNSDPREKVAQTYDCPTCGVASGYVCVSTSGRMSKHSHKMRLKKVPQEF